MQARKATLISVTALSFICITTNSSLAQRNSRPQRTQGVKSQSSNRSGLDSSALKYSDLVLLRTLNDKGTFALSPDGKLLVSRNALWNVPEGIMKRAWTKPLNYLDGSITVSQGDWVLLGKDSDKLILWNSQNEDLEQITFAAEKSVEVGALSPNGELLATGYYVWITEEEMRATVQMQEAHTGEMKWAIDIQKDSGGFSNTKSITFSPDGQILAIVTGFYGTVTLLETQTGKILRTLEDTGGFKMSVAFSGDGQTLAIGSGWDAILVGEVNLFDVPTGRLKNKLKIDLSGGFVNSVAFSTDGKIIASGSQDKVRFWNAQTGKLVFTLKAVADTMAFLPDGKTFVTSTNYEPIKLWRSRAFIKSK
jgi:WD40 repeat protein